MVRSKGAAMGQPAPKTELEKGLVMGTNGSSIVSKRSVEQLYYPEPHFIRYFVKKRQRRSPLINRGYWLRMYAIEHTVRSFLQEPSSRPKLVLNFGCGFDPLPFQFLTREKHLCENARFVDIDYHKLMVEKRNTIRHTSALNGIIPEVEFPPEDGPVLFRSKYYIGIGCDLVELSKLETTLKSENGSITDYSILCTAEVSLTYMDIPSANALLQWASKLSDDTRFCLLEQIFPDGPNHPFAQTMMSHFEKLRTPLFSVHKYPSLRQQEERFTEAGWSHASAKSLWTLWSDSQFLSDVQRMDLDKIETFDEWEEFALFASHYFLLVATTKIPDTDINIHDAREYTCSSIQTRSLTLEPRYPLKFSAQRRFGSLVPLRGGRVGLHGGWGLQTRLSSTQVFSDSAVKEPITDPLPTGIAARMCHSTTILGNDCLLSGGRASPAMPFGDCWLGSQGKWEQVDSLPIPCFRHSTVPLDLDSSKAVLLFGGKSGNGDVLGKFFIWTEKKGWNEVPVVGTIPESRFGALMISIDDHTGILCGGMSQAGLILNDFWFWSVLQSSDGPLHVSCMRLSENTPAAASLRWLSRFGSTANLLGDNIVIMGGVNVDGCIPQPLEVLTLNINILRLLMQGPQEHLASSLVPGNVQIDPETARPLLIGHSSIAIDNDKILVIGGGAVCFSFGTFWNKGTFLLRDGVPGARNEWFPVESAANFEHRSTEITTPKEQRVLTNTISVVTVPRVKITNSQDFRTIVDKSRPVILEGLNIGRCVEVWTKEYLQAAVGHGRKVVVHDAQMDHMDFRKKNFSYVTKDFRTFLDEVHNGSRQYLRALSDENPSEQPANFAADFPGLKDDFHLPPELSLVSENAHSSPLRISGPVILWLHYDVLANVLCQVQGEKRLVLYPPWDVSKLGFAPGASSSSINVFQSTASQTSQLASPPGTTPHEAHMKPGDILFLPPLWLHTACPTTGVSVAVNVFFRSLAHGYAPGRDVYGNRDLHAYEKGRKNVEKIIRSFDRLPRDIAQFYLHRLADELQNGVAT